jgi:hypothetical protein
MAKAHGTQIRRLVDNFALDPKFTSPDQLMEFMLKKELFSPVARLVPPTPTKKART